MGLVGGDSSTPLGHLSFLALGFCISLVGGQFTFSLNFNFNFLFQLLLLTSIFVIPYSTGSPLQGMVAELKR